MLLNEGAHEVYDMSSSSPDSLPPAGRTYEGTTAALLADLAVDPTTGLTAAEAQARLARYGPNSLETEAKTPLWRRILEQFRDIMVIILIIAAIISGFLGDWIEAVIILAIVVVNAILGVVQEGRAEEAVAALQSMSSPTARVIRDGRQEVLPSDDIVPGDILILEAGDIVPADARLLESSNLKADESALTGESVPVEKDADFVTEKTLGIGDRANMLFSSTSLTYGRGRALALRTGHDSEMGRIAGRLTAIKQELTPLQVGLNQLGRYLAIFCLLVVALTFAVGILRGGDIFSMFMTSVSLAVAAIPEGLAAVVTIVLALGMNRMAEKNAIVKRLLAVETLGSVNVICSDKTGTLTQNEMTVTRLYAGDRIYQVTGSGYVPEGTISALDGEGGGNDGELLERLFLIATLCNEAELREGDNGWEMIGDPTEGALLSVAAKHGCLRADLEERYPRRGDLPFDSERKMMTVFHDGLPEGELSLTKGAPDIIVDRCTSILTVDGVEPLTPVRRDAILAANSAFARTALRVLAFAYRVHPGGDHEGAEEEMTFVGLTGMIDPARPEARDAIAVCRRAGIRPVMITGDYRDTAVAIALDLGLMHDDDGVLIGSELEAMSDGELAAASEKTSVYARVSPEHKVRIVEALQSHGHITSMTGDGVNDAPALKRADIGVAMGITGTEVAKSAADMILMDDNFATIVNAVEQGRVIYANIRKFVGFLLSCNVGEILVIFITIMVLGPDMTPLLPIQLLWLNLITDSFPALALGREEAEPDVMEQPPRRRTDRILNREMIASIAVQAMAIFGAVFAAFRAGLARYGTMNDAGREIPSHGALTFAFVTLIAAELLRAFSNRSEHYSVFRQGMFSNPTMNRSILLAIGLTLAVVYLPFLNPLFHTIPLRPADWGIILPLALLPFVTGELFKLIYHRDLRAKRNHIN